MRTYNPNRDYPLVREAIRNCHNPMWVIALFTVARVFQGQEISWPNGSNAEEARAISDAISRALRDIGQPTL